MERTIMFFLTLWNIYYNGVISGRFRCTIFTTNNRIKTFKWYLDLFSFYHKPYYFSGPLLQRTRAQQYFLKAAEVFGSMNPLRIPPWKMKKEFNCNMLSVLVLIKHIDHIFYLTCQHSNMKKTFKKLSISPTCSYSNTAGHNIVFPLKRTLVVYKYR